jgi:hypothetical protein
MTFLRFQSIRFFLLLALCGLLWAGDKIKISGYSEFRKSSALVVDGQYVVTGQKTKFKGRGIYDLSNIPLGYEVEVKGTRQLDGRVLASEIKAKPNGIAMFETDVLRASDQIEQVWVKEGAMFNATSDGKKQTIGRIRETGSDVARVRRIMSRLIPPYVDADSIRVRVVQTKEWNASAMGNGAIWVYSGLIKDMRDDELAIILGHELAHFTHEHSRRNAKKRMWGQFAALAGMVGASTVGGSTGNLAGMATLLSVTAWQSGYSRDLEDQADRVGLRYVREAGYDVNQGPRLWERFREKYGEQDNVSNFFVGSHSRPSDRIKNLDREIRLNYQD